MMIEQRRLTLATLHQHPAKGVFVITGGGSLLLSDLLTTAGASATVLEASIPYSSGALASYLRYSPKQACAETTACQLAMAALQRAVELSGSISAVLFGFSITASLASNRPKRGTHRVHMALQTLAATAHRWVEFEKDKRSRAEEERLVADLALQFLSERLGSKSAPIWDQPEKVQQDTVEAQPSWQSLLTDFFRGKKSKIIARGDNEKPTLLFPGSFHPLHDAHRAMAQRAGDLYGEVPAFEICINNVDKPPLDYIDIEHRLRQFNAPTNDSYGTGANVACTNNSVWLTSYATFLEKARAFPGVTFIVGVDTLLRIDEPRYYTKSSRSGQTAEELRNLALKEIGSLGSEFLVFPRTINGAHQSLEDLSLSPRLTALCKPAGDFEFEISSSEIRSASNNPGKKRQ